MRNLMLAVLFSCILLSGFIWADNIPNTLNVQGRLTHSDGKPRGNDSVWVRIAIFDDPIAGND